MKMYPLKFEPIFKQRIWGGQKLAEVFGKDLDEGKKIGESWELADLPDDKSVIANGQLAGLTLAEAIEKYPKEITGDENADLENEVLWGKMNSFEEAEDFNYEPKSLGEKNIHNTAQMGGILTNPLSSGEEEFVPHGSYTVSNAGGYEVMLNDAGDAARVRDAYGSDNPQTSDWLEIEYVQDEPVIDPNGYNIPLNQVRTIHHVGITSSKLEIH